MCPIVGSDIRLLEATQGERLECGSSSSQNHVPKHSDCDLVEPEVAQCELCDAWPAEAASASSGAGCHHAKSAALHRVPTVVDLAPDPIESVDDSGGSLCPRLPAQSELAQGTTAAKGGGYGNAGGWRITQEVARIESQVNDARRVGHRFDQT